MSLDTYGAAVGLLDLRRLRSLYRGIRTNFEGTPPASADETLVDLTATPFTTPADAHDRLDRLRAALRDRGDRRSVFLTIYVRMTRDVRRELERGTFDNPDWMRDYLVTFAEYYRRAFLSFERGRIEAVPRPWRIAFGTALTGDALVAQDAFLGISAHINYDLALAVRDVGIQTNRPSKYADHRRINGILERLVDEQQRALSDVYAPGLETVDAALGSLDESLSMFSMAEAREQAWRVAVILTDVSLNVIKRYAQWVLRGTAVGAAAFVLAPGLDPTVYEAMRLVEQRRLDLDKVLDQIETQLDSIAPPDT